MSNISLDASSDIQSACLEPVLVFSENKYKTFTAPQPKHLIQSATATGWSLSMHRPDGLKIPWTTMDVKFATPFSDSLTLMCIQSRRVRVS